MASHLPSGSLSRRFARAAAILAAAAVLLGSLASFWLIDRQREEANALLQQREVLFHATTVSNNLQALASRMADVAASPILATALVDSAGKETYLTPFLRGLRQINGIPVQVLFTDFEGKPIAGNGNGDFSQDDRDWLRQRIDSDSELAAIRPGAGGGELLGVYLLRYSRTHTPEGALMYKVRLADLQPVPGSALAIGAAGPGSAQLKGLPPSLAPLGLALREDMRKLPAPLPSPAPQYALIVGIAVALAAAVFLLGARLALGLTEDLRRLQAFAASIGDEGISTQRAPLAGSSEVVGLANSINRMLDRLYHQHSHLEAERGRFLQLSNTIRQLVFIAEPDGRISWFNDRWYEFTGKGPGELDPTNWQELHDPQVLPEVLRRWHETRALGQMAQMTFPMRGADGRFRSFFTSVAPLRDASGRIVQWFGTCTDITELEEARQAARYSEERLRQGLVAAHMAVWERDPVSGQLTFAANLKSVFGRSWHNIDQFWELLDAQERPAIMAEVERGLAERGEFNGVHRIRRADDGSTAWVEMRGKLGVGADGRHQVVHSIAIDVTERKRAEEALRLADRRKDEFLAMLAHELRNPLAPISSAADMLRLAYASEPRVRQISEIIARQVGHMRHLVDDLLDVSRVTRGLVAVARERLDLVRVVGEAVEQSRPLVDARSHRLTLDLAPAPVTVIGDHTRLVQVVTNLLNNAAKYTPDGGAIGVTLACAGGMAQLEVRDNGVGIGPDLLPAVFELFTQATRTLDRTQGGLGLGLALVKKLVELHGGSVEARSDGLGYGSVFVVRLPLATPATRPQDEAARAA
ncbi:PAS domain-containing sensor histidine kinase [Massilia agilis]|uniref:histidine kinase n=1 Tax=Massilia agilis TaxID=1811226 RepID=A0ABT2DHN3_9BURK|nr:PAS domain-containing sensor histidine kinase [Massilia agilis]MCS0810815.1 PAS domain-containing sensor histidine kinase [Massilia agilis]